VNATASMFVPDDAHRKRVADAVRTAGLTATVSLNLSADEADNLHTLAVNHYRQVREELDQPTRNMILAVLQVLDEATKAAFAKEEAGRQHHRRVIDRMLPILAGNLDLHINALQAAELVGVLSAVELQGITDDLVVDGVVKRLDKLRFAADLGHQAQQRAVARRLLALYRETETVTA
jgi:hypothetical protein